MIAEAEFRTFQALGGTVTIQAGGHGSAIAVAAAERIISEIQSKLTRFESGSELSLLNADPSPRVQASPLMLRFAETVGYAGELSGGLVDATLLGEIESAGYASHIDPEDGLIGSPSIDQATPDGIETSPAGPSPQALWRTVRIDEKTGEVIREPGVKLDSGGIGKGLAADMAAEHLGHLDHFAVECVGELRFGNARDVERPVKVASPFKGEPPVAEFRLRGCAVATSGITRRSWLDQQGNRQHHLIDPRSGKPAYTGVIQVTAFAPTAVEAEVRAKAALLSGPGPAPGWLVHGGVAVLADGQTVVVDPAPEGDRHE